MQDLRSGLEGLTFDTPVGKKEERRDQAAFEELNKLFSCDSKTATTGNMDDVRRIQSQNYTSDILSDVFKRASNISASSTQETAKANAFADLFSSGSAS